MREQNGHALKELYHEEIGKSDVLADKYSSGSCATSDSPDGSSRTIDSDSNDHVYIPLHSPTNKRTDVIVVGQAVDVNVVNAVRGEFLQV